MNSSKRIGCAAAALVLSTGIAIAAPARVETDLNVRSGEGTGFPVIAVMPAGATVDVSGCADGWCYVSDYNGFASADYLNIAGWAYTAPAPAYVAPPVAVLPAPIYRERHYWSGPRIIQRGVRHFRRDLRQERRQDRREVRQERRQDRRELRQDRRAERREARQEQRENRQDRRRN